MVSIVVIVVLVLLLAAMVVENFRLARERDQIEREVSGMTTKLLREMEQRINQKAEEVALVTDAEVTEPDEVAAARPYVYALRLAGIELDADVQRLVYQAIEEGWSTSVLYRRVKEMRGGS